MLRSSYSDLCVHAVFSCSTRSLISDLEWNCSMVCEVLSFPAPILNVYVSWLLGTYTQFYRCMFVESKKCRSSCCGLALSLERSRLKIWFGVLTSIYWSNDYKDHTIQSLKVTSCTGVILNRSEACSSVEHHRRFLCSTPTPTLNIGYRAKLQCWINSEIRRCLTCT
jgi:hypothetical protein